MLTEETVAILGVDPDSIDWFADGGHALAAGGCARSRKARRAIPERLLERTSIEAAA
jgi:hypothetical protein